MGLRGGLLRAQRNCLYSLVPFGGGSSCGRRAGANCACASSHTHAGGDSVAPAAISPNAADPRNFVGRTSPGKCCGGFPAFNGRRIQKALRGSRASGLALKSLRIISHSSRARGRGETIEHLYSLAGPAPHGVWSSGCLRASLALAKKLHKLTIHLLGVRPTYAVRTVFHYRQTR